MWRGTADAVWLRVAGGLRWSTVAALVRGGSSRPLGFHAQLNAFCFLPRDGMLSLQAEVSQLRNANGDSVAASEERLRQLQADYEDLQRWVRPGGTRVVIVCTAHFARPVTLRR